MPTPNNFEKQVQQKMEELKFTPSEAVWQEVQKQIRERKERRRLLLWWWLLPFFTAGSIGIYIWSKTEKAHKNPIVAGRVLPCIADDMAKNHYTPPAGSLLSPARPEPVQGSKGEASHLNKLNNLNNNTTVPYKIAHNKSRYTLPAGNDGINNGLTDHLTEHLIDLNARETTSSAGNTTPVAAAGETGLQPAVVRPLGSNLFAIGLPPLPPLPPADSKAATQKLLPPKKKMEWIATAHAGRMDIFSGLNILSSGTTYDYMYASAIGPQSSPNTNGGLTAATVTYKPSDIKPGWSFSAGLSLRRYTRRTFSLEAGLLYSYSTTSITVGHEVSNTTTVRQGQTTISDYYTNSGTMENYTNRYHFLELPVRIQKQLGVRSPLSLHTGLTLGRLLGSNALQYDAGTNVYYKDNSLFHKTQLSISAGIDLRLWARRPVSLEIGPRVQYGLTNLFDKKIYGNQHTVFAGLEMRFIFGKK